jgi:hypothetical protein
MEVTMLLREHGMRLQQIGDLSDREHQFLWMMQEYPPESQLQHGDICYLDHVSPRLLHNPHFVEFGFPRFWKVQFVVSAYQFEMHNAMQNTGFGGDQAYTYLDAGGFDFRRANEPVVYAHGFPHGDNPNTTQWFPETCLRKLCLRTEDVDWEPVLDEFRTPFHGYDHGSLRGGFVLDMAPDRYAEGLHLGGPLSHEEPTFHAAASVGLEAAMMTKEDPRLIRTYTDVDPDHDVFVHPWDER